MRVQFIVLLILSAFVLLIGFSQKSNLQARSPGHKLAKDTLVRAVSKLPILTMPSP